MTDRARTTASGDAGGAVAAYVLVGGRSSRFGGDKALHPIRDRPMVLRVADRLARLSTSVTLVGANEGYDVLGLPVIADKEPGLGPLGGIVTALEHSADDWNLIVACDLPFVEDSLLSMLVEKTRTTHADIVLPRSPDGLQPLCAAYSKRAAKAVREAIRKGIRKVTDAFAEIEVEMVSVPEAASFTNINRPGDLEKALKDRETAV